MNALTIREYGLLYREGFHDQLDARSIPASAWDWLLENGQADGDSEKCLVRPKRASGTLVLQVLNYVGVLESPCGTRIEILPKIASDQDSEDALRRMLLRMLARVHHLKLETFHRSNLAITHSQLIESLIHDFLSATERMVKRGIRSDYSQVSEELSYLRGRLNLSLQLRQRPGRDHLFQVTHDAYLPDRAENRLVHSALLKILTWSKLSSNQRRARELLFAFHEIPESLHVETDFKQWRTDRSLAHYRPLKPWCELILRERSPTSMSGRYHGLSFLFPMQDLFERYLAWWLRHNMDSQFRLTSQARSKYMVEHKGEEWFQLKPDFLIHLGNAPVAVLDAKWKRLSQVNGTPRDKYGLSQADFYQMYAYGQRYLDGEGDMILIFPASETFNKALEHFDYSSKLRLWVVPFDLKQSRLVLDSVVEKPKWLARERDGDAQAESRVGLGGLVG